MKMHEKNNRFFHYIVHHFSAMIAVWLLTIILFFFSYSYYVYHTREFMLLFYIIYMLSILSITIFIFVSLREINMKIDLEYLEMQKKAAQRQEENLQSSQRAMEKQLNEMKQHLREMADLLEEGHLDEAKKVCGEFSTTFQSATYKSYCQNDTLDVILHGKKTECDNLGISFSCDVLFPEEIQIPSPVFISLFFNLLNNGIESCEASGQAKPFLKLSIDYKGSFLFIRMENSKNPQVIFTHTTTKADPLHHGLGLSIIEEIVRKRQGNCQWMDCGNTFISEIILNYML